VSRPDADKDIYDIFHRYIQAPIEGTGYEMSLIVWYGKTNQMVSLSNIYTL